MQLQGISANIFVMQDFDPDNPKHCNALEAWAALLLTERELQDKIEEQLKRAHLPPLDWYHVLDELLRSERGGLRQSALQKCTKLAQYNICRLIDRLQREGLVERQACPVDARNNVIILSAKGRDVHAAMQPVYSAAVDAHMGTRLSHGEAAQLRALLLKLQAG